VSNVEKTFILEAVSNGKRTDGRHLEERRNVEIHFGNEYGSCVASLGQTRVSAQVSCSVMEPRATRPNEGMVFIYVEFPPMCSQR
jgi:exosome complex component RRP45